MQIPVRCLEARTGEKRGMSFILRHPKLRESFRREIMPWKFWLPETARTEMCWHSRLILPTQRNCMQPFQLIRKSAFTFQMIRVNIGQKNACCRMGQKKFLSFRHLLTIAEQYMWLEKIQ